MAERPSPECVPQVDVARAHERVSPQNHRWALAVRPELSYLSLNELTALPHDAQDFVSVYEGRRAALAERIRRKRGSGLTAPIAMEEVEESDGTELDAALEEQCTGGG